MSILRKLFGKGRPDPRDIAQLIFDLAEHDSRPADLDELYRRLPGIELYAIVLSANFPLQHGARHTVDAGEILQIQSATLPSGQRLAQFFVDRADKRLEPVCIGMSSREACEMALNDPDMDGLMLCNPTDSWVALLKPELRSLLSRGILPLSARAL